MLGPWKERKSKSSFPAFSTVPWKSRERREIPTFPPPGFAAMEKWKTKNRFPTFPHPLATTTLAPSNPKSKTKGSRPLRGLRSLQSQDHLVLETKVDFRIILRLENAAEEEWITANRKFTSRLPNDDI
jgi:hypothetical protein